MLQKESSWINIIVEKNFQTQHNGAIQLTFIILKCVRLRLMFMSIIVFWDSTIQRSEIFERRNEFWRTIIVIV